MIIHDPEAQQINFADERFYLSKNGVDYYPSVTEILSHYPKGEFFTDWLKQVGYNADIIIEKAGTQGTKIHDAIDILQRGGEVIWDGSNYSIAEWKMICRFMEFWTVHKPERIISEVSFCSDTLKFGGTIDLVCKLNGQIWLIDYKSSNALHKSYDIQMSAYAQLWNEINPDYPIERTGILWLKSQTRGEDKKGKTIQGKGWILKEPAKPIEDLFKLFKHTQALWVEENPNYKPYNLILPDRFKI